MQDKIQAQFTTHPQLQVLFFFDGNGTYAEALEDWQLPNIVLLKGSQRYFYLKHQLFVALQGKKVFLYFPFARPTGKAWNNFPLLSTYYANQELKMDEIGQFADKYDLKPHHLNLIKKYINLLRLKKVQEVLTKILNSENFNEANLKRGLISYYLGLRTVSDQTLCLVRLLTLSLKPKVLHKAIKDIRKADLETTIQQWIHRYFDEKLHKGLSEDAVIRLAQKVKYNVLLGRLATAPAEDNYGKLRIKNQMVFGRLDALWVDWNNSRDKAQIDAVFNQTAKSVQVEKLIKWYGTQHPFGYFTEDMSDAVLSLAFQQILHQPEKAKETIINWCNRVNTGSLFSYFEALKHTAYCFTLLASDTDFLYNAPDAYIKAYQDKWWQMDYHYRKAVYHHKQAIALTDSYQAALEEVLPTLHDKYDRFLVRLNVEWVKIMAEQSFDYTQLQTPKQSDFYARDLAAMEYKAAVIISDGLRYEAAHDLYNELLKSDDKVTVEISPMLASIPSYTKLGMANLLPNDGLHIEKDGTDLRIRINGISTEGLDNRRKILRQVRPKAEVMAFSDIRNLNQQKGRELFKAHPLVYIYHNQIDLVGDNQKSEKQTFEAVQRTILELKELIGKLRNRWNVYYIYITSDHGFLYNDQPLKVASTEEMPKDKAVFSRHGRFLLSDQPYDHEAGYSFPLRHTTNSNTPIKVHLPRAINRYKRQGSGKQYVHGGASLQELIVPTVFYFKKRDDADLEVVKVRLLNQRKLKITANALKVRFLQEEPVNNERKKSVLLIGIYTKDGTLLSNEKQLTFDKTSTNPTERLRNKLLTLSTSGSRSTFCYFRVFDWNGKNPDRLNPIIEERLTNNTLMELDEF